MTIRDCVVATSTSAPHMMESLLLDRRLGLLNQDHPGSSSLVEALDRSIWRRNLKCYVIIYHTLLLCLRTDWDAAIKVGLSL